MPANTARNAPGEIAEPRQKRKPGRPKGSKPKQGGHGKLLDDKHFDGYLKFLNERRSLLPKTKRSSTSFEKVTKQLTKEWLTLPTAEKQKYCNSSDNTGHHPSEPSSSCKQKAGRSSASSSSVNSKSTRTTRSNTNSQDIPIFTDAFLDHNKVKESELHSLNKANCELEKQNILLEAHVHNLEDAIVQLESHIEAEETKNTAIQVKLRNTQLMFYNAFKDLPHPVTNAKPTVEGIQDYVTEVCTLLENNSPEHTLFIAKVYEKLNVIKAAI